MKNSITNALAGDDIRRHFAAIDKLVRNEYLSAPHQPDTKDVTGLSGLQKATALAMNHTRKGWGFSGSAFEVKRQRLDNNIWKITVQNPTTQEIILEAEGDGDKVFAYEDHLAKMAETLADQDIKITTRFNK